MSRIFKNTMGSILFFLASQVSGQELEFLPPVKANKPNKDTTPLILNLLDFARDEQQFEKKPYTYCIQVVDASQPWPPIWYVAKPVYTDEMYTQDTLHHNRHVNFLENPEVNGDYIFYLQIYPLNKVYDTTKTFDVQHSAFFGVIDKHFNLVDSIVSARYRGGHYGPDYRSDANIEVLNALRKDTVLDLRKISHQECDSAIDCEYGVIFIKDVKGNIKFSWTPLDHLEPALFRVKEKLGHLPMPPNGKLRDIRWMKLSSVNWDYDGNILYGVEDVGIGKVSRDDGHVIWQLNFSDASFITGADTLACHSPYDFKVIQDNKTTVLYSFYERGSQNIHRARGVVFEQNKKTKKLKLVKYVWPEEVYTSNGHGGFDYDPVSGNFVIDYGVFTHSDTITSDFWDAFEYGKNDSTYTIYQIPKWNYPFGVHRLDNFPCPPRPSVHKAGTELETTGDMKNWVWYELKGLGNFDITKVGVGSRFRPLKNGTYCVAGAYGCGYSVSRPFIYHK